MKLVALVAGAVRRRDRDRAAARPRRHRRRDLSGRINAVSGSSDAVERDRRRAAKLVPVDRDRGADNAACGAETRDRRGRHHTKLVALVAVPPAVVTVTGPLLAPRAPSR